MLRCRGLRKLYNTDRGPIEAVRGVDLDVPAGQFASIVGRSGSGKSSLMAMIGGLSRPTGGQVLLDDIDIWSLDASALAQFRGRRIGYIFQFPSLLQTVRVVDNVALPALLCRQASVSDVYERAEDLLDSVGLGRYADAYPSELSAGEQRRTVIARALINAPSLLLADEPTSDLDEQAERDVMKELLRVNREGGTALVLITHNPALAACADQVIRIADGAVS